MDYTEATISTTTAGSEIVSDLLMRLGVDEETASADACRMEHVISDQSFQAIRRHVEK